MLEVGNRDAGLDGLRGFAAVSVVLFHILDGMNPSLPSLQAFKIVTNAGAQMVAVFFVLSGFFISRSMASLQAHHSSPKRAFALRRALRILPLWFVLLVFLYGTGQIDHRVFLANLFFYFGDLSFEANPWLPVIPAWTLQSEVIFYVLATLWMGWLVQLKPHQLFFSWISSLLLLTVWRSLGVPILGLSPHFTHVFFIGQFHYFIAGLFLGRLLALGEVRKFFAQDFKGFWIMDIFVLWMFWACSRPNFFAFPLALLAPSLVATICFDKSLLRQILAGKVFRIMGLCSFGIYILQREGRMLSMRFFPLSGGEWLYVLGQLTFCLVLGLIAYFLIERPFIQLSKKA